MNMLTKDFHLARLVSTENEEGGVAVISIGTLSISAMDCLVYGASLQSPIAVGDEFTPRFTCLFDDQATWSSVFEGNPNREKKLVKTGLWSYSAFGELVCVDSLSAEAMVDCGGLLLPIPIEISDASLLSEFVAFDIVRLDVWKQ